jgi:hypothetical protein
VTTEQEQERLRAEADVIAATGISQADLRGYRKNMLEDQVHFRKISGRVFYTPAGIARICSVIGADSQAVNSQKNKGTSDLLVLRTGFRNRTILEGRHPDGAVVRIRVRDCKNFLPGMNLAGCLHIEEDLWDYVGKMPRARGVW